MRKEIAGFAVMALLLAGANWAAAQTVQGRAFGSDLDLAGTPLLTSSDTGIHTAPSASNTPNPSTMNATAAEAVVPLDPIAEVDTGPSQTRGCSTPNACATLFSTPGLTALDPSLADEVFVRSEASNATASVLIDQPTAGTNVLDVVTSGSQVTVRCDNGTRTVSADGQVEALVINGMPLNIPGHQEPNTEFLVPGFPLIRLNEQQCTPTGCTVNALHAQVLPQPQAPASLDLIDLRLSSSFGGISTATCACTGAIFVNDGTGKTAQVLNPNGTPKSSSVPNPGDKIRYTLRIQNTGCAAATNVSIIDRLPSGVTIDPTSLPSGATVGACPDVTFTQCTGQSSDQCLTVPVGTVNVGAPSQSFAFVVTVNAGAGCSTGGGGSGICNTAVIQSSEIQGSTGLGTSIAACPSGTPTPGGGGGNGTPTPGGGGGNGTPTPTPGSGSGGGGIGGGGIGGGGTLETTGSGGCSLSPGSGPGTSETFPVLFLGLWLTIRRRRSHPGRP